MIKLTKEEAIQNIIDYFATNDSLLTDCIEELDSYNGFLGDDRIYSMDELDEIYSHVEPTEILFRAFYGRDAETWHTDEHGEKEYGPFNPNRDYFYFNGYGNLISCNWRDYSDKNDKYLIEELFECRSYINSINKDDSLAELFDALEAADKED